MLSLRKLLPPGAIVGGRPAPWVLVAFVAGLAGAGWLVSPAGLAERVIRRREPTATGRALGYAASYELGPTVDPLGVLLTREQLRVGLGDPEPEYRGRRLPPALIAPRWPTVPLVPQDVRPLAAQAPYRQPPARPGVSITAAQVLQPPKVDR